MASPVDISVCNEALAELPQDPIQSLDEASLGARECKRSYASTLKELLATSDWEASRVRTALATTVNDRPNEWGYAYALPDDCVNPLRLAPDASYFWNDDWWPTTFDGGGSPAAVIPAFMCLGRYELANGTIYAHEVGATLEYTSGDPGRWTPLFRRAFVLELATRLVLPVTKSTSRQQALIAMSETAKQRAMADNENRQPRAYTSSRMSRSEEARQGYWY
jgi:hypothetical protein